MNKTRVVTAIVIIAATVAGSAILLMPSLQQQASAQGWSQSQIAE